MSVVQVVCLGPTHVRGNVWNSTIHTLNGISSKRTGQILAPPQPSTMAGLAALRYELRIGSRRLIEWKFECYGWLYVAGILLHPDDDPAAIEAKGLAVLSTWQWLAPAPAVPPSA